MSDSKIPLEELMKINYTYPSPSDSDFQSKIYQKREFYYHKMADRPDMSNYADIKEYRDNVCARRFALHEHQSFLSNFINPDTPYRGLLVFHGVGTGKTGAAIAIAEKFKNMVQKYGTKIHVLVPGPIVKDNWKDELLKTTGETYLKVQNNSIYINDYDIKKARKNALNLALQYYRFMSYRSFYKKVLGEKIRDLKTTKDNKTKSSYRKTSTGEFERDIAVDRIHSLNNSLIIADEAHNLTGNSFGEALMKVVKESDNLKVVLLSATPMKNLGHDIVQLLNFIRPPDDPVIRERIFTSNTRAHLMSFKEGGLDYLKKMARGYISYLRGSDPLTFAKRVEKGKIAKGLQFTKVTECKMLPFQEEVYFRVANDTGTETEDGEKTNDTLDRATESVANFVFPGLSEDRKGLSGYYGREGLVTVINQLKTNQDLLNKKVATELLKDFDTSDEGDLVRLSDSGKSITGSFLKMKYLKLFSTKFYRALKKINRLVWGKKGPRTAFVYSNLVRVGIEMFQEILLQNGFLEYQENSANYTIQGDTRCYYCGKTFKEHKDEEKRKQSREKKEKKDKASESSSDYEPHTKAKVCPDHTFHPMTFVTVTGKSTEDGADVIPEDKQRILRGVFSHIDNKEGKKIKLVLGSKVMNEGLSLFNVAEIHILDVHFTLGKVEQVIGRGIRVCSHYGIIDDDNPFPHVNIYKYAITIAKGMSSEIELYKKAEMKHLLIKKVERALKEVAIDCPLNRPGNIFPEDIKQYAKCGEPGHEHCPAICDYTKCNFKCDGDRLNADYYDSKTNMYKKISKNKLDFSTFTNALAQNEIDYAKQRIKEIYKTKYVDTLKNIVKYVKKSYSEEKRELFAEFFVYRALQDLIPVTENDFNNFTDTILDKYNRPGYLIYVDHYYLFQPFDQNEDVPMHYRTTYDKPLLHQLPISNYLKNTTKYRSFKGSRGKKKMGDKAKALLKDDKPYYDFESVREYYDSRPEFEVVGIVDKEASRRKNKRPEEMKDVFKIREKRAKILVKKRGTGIPSLKGAVCATSKEKDYLEKLGKKLGVKVKDNETRYDICNDIRDALLMLEKYSTDKLKNKFTYVMIPANHPTFPFPYNLEDRKRFIIKKIKDKIKFKFEMAKREEKTKTAYRHVVEIKNSKDIGEFSDFFKSLGGELKGSKWVFIID